MACEHFPLIDGLDIPEATREVYCRLTREDHPGHLVYRRDIEAIAAGRPFERDQSCGAGTATIQGGASHEDAKPTITRINSDPEPTNHYTDLLKLVEACEHRGEQIKGEAGCGCDRTWHCAMKKGPFVTSPFEVSKSDCVRGELSE
ncbi:hypothetical protein [Singulisphaera sp. PoT]|uniref:hypothetical protein n=1 Tax=Singulisphaera sp. PoT TaxID=3411797 RepID=UPI003BF4E11D